MESGELRGRSFFLTALVEYDARPGPARDELVTPRIRWEEPFTRLWSGAEDLGHVRSGVDGSQLFFEIAGLIAAATLESKLRDDTSAFDRARAGVAARLDPLLT